MTLLRYALSGMAKATSSARYTPYSNSSSITFVTAPEKLVEQVERKEDAQPSYEACYEFHLDPFLSVLLRGGAYDSTATNPA